MFAFRFVLSFVRSFVRSLIRSFAHSLVLAVRRLTGKIVSIVHRTFHCACVMDAVVGVQLCMSVLTFWISHRHLNLSLTC